MQPSIIYCKAAGEGADVLEHPHYRNEINRHNESCTDIHRTAADAILQKSHRTPEVSIRKDAVDSRQGM